MTDEELFALAEKIRDKTATEEEIIIFSKEYNKLYEELKNDLSKKEE